MFYYDTGRADTKNKRPTVAWLDFQNNPIPEELHNQWKSENKFLDGMAVILGKVWHNLEKSGLYLNGIDLDNLKAIEEVCKYDGKAISIKELSQWTLVEQHSDDTNRAHIYIYSYKPFAKKSNDKNKTNSSGLTDKIESSEVPAIEVKGLGEHGMLFCSPSMHKKGQQFQIIGTQEPVIADDFEQHIDNVCKRYGISYLQENGNGRSSKNPNQIPIEDLFKSDFKVYEGHNRHEALLRTMESLIKRNQNILDLDAIKRLSKEWNNSGQHCIPPLDKQEFEKQWSDATRFIAKTSTAMDNNDQEQRSARPSSSSSSSAAQKAIELVENHCSEFFQDQFGNPYATVKIDKHLETLQLKGARFKHWLCHKFYEASDKSAMLNGEHIASILNILQARADFEGVRKELELRVSKIKNDPFTIYYDLANKDCEAIKIVATSEREEGETEVELETISNNNKNGWTIEQAPIIFRRYSSQKPQVYPVRGYPKDIFDQFMNLINVSGEDKKLLLKCYIITLFYPDIIKPLTIRIVWISIWKSEMRDLNSSSIP